MFSSKLHLSWGEWERKKKYFNKYILHFIYHFVLYANYLKRPTAGKGAVYPCKLAGLECAAGYINFTLMLNRKAENSEGNPSESKKRKKRTKQKIKPKKWSMQIK